MVVAQRNYHRKLKILRLLFTEETNYEKDAFFSTKRNVKGGLKTVYSLLFHRRVII